MTHPHLEIISIEAARREINLGRERLQQLFQQPIQGFAYPFGTYNKEVMKVVKDTGHLYARTTGSVAYPFPPADPMAFHPCCHFRAPDFLQQYERAKKGGVFYFWGHSYELVSKSIWQDIENKIKFISKDTESTWDG